MSDSDRAGSDHSVTSGSPSLLSVRGITSCPAPRAHTDIHQRSGPCMYVLLHDHLLYYAVLYSQYNIIYRAAGWQDNPEYAAKPSTLLCCHNPASCPRGSFWFIIFRRGFLIFYIFGASFPFSSFRIFLAELAGRGHQAEPIITRQNNIPSQSESVTATFFRVGHWTTQTRDKPRTEQVQGCFERLATTTLLLRRHRVC